MMDTEYCRVDRERPQMEVLSGAAAKLRRGELVAFPTETVYGLGANGLDPQAIAAIYQAKGRPSDNPLILHIAEVSAVEDLAVDICANARALMAKYWPGPLTLVLKRRSCVPDSVTGGLDTVAVRLPACVVAQELIHQAGVPVAAPSANTSGRPSPTSAAAVLADLSGKISLVLDAGDCAIGVESTVVDCTTPTSTLLRPGGITLEMLTAVLGVVELDPALAAADEVPRSPGMKYTHYAPQAPMLLFEGDGARLAAALAAEISRALEQGKTVGAAVSVETAAQLPAGVQLAVLGSRYQPAEFAANLFRALRSFDGTPVELIVAEGIAEQGLGLAVMNRLRKASGYRIRKV